jgi:hypothetical protein
LAEATGGRLHLLNVSSASSVDQIRRVKSRGVNITAGIVPINAVLTDECLRSFDANFKLNPPLRSQEHVDACLAGLTDGTIDVISSGHTPRAAEKKMLELDRAPFGMVALETTLGLVVTKLIEPGHLDWMSALAKMTINPARVLGIDKGTLRIGADADIVIIDPHAVLDRRSGRVPFEEYQHPLGRLDVARPRGANPGRRSLQAIGMRLGIQHPAWYFYVKSPERGFGSRSPRPRGAFLATLRGYESFDSGVRFLVSGCSGSFPAVRARDSPVQTLLHRLLRFRWSTSGSLLLLFHVWRLVRLLGAGRFVLLPFDLSGTAGAVRWAVSCCCNACFRKSSRVSSWRSRKRRRKSYKGKSSGNGSSSCCSRPRSV